MDLHPYDIERHDITRHDNGPNFQIIINSSQKPNKILFFKCGFGMDFRGEAWGEAWGHKHCVD